MVLSDVHPIGRDRLVAQQRGVGSIRAYVVDVDAIGQARDVIRGLARAGRPVRILRNPLERLQAFGPDGGLIESVGRYGRGFRTAARVIGGAADVVIDVGMVVADAQDEILLTRVQDGIVPGDRLWKAVQFCGGRRVGPLRHVSQMFEIARHGVIQLADVVVGHVVVSGLAKLVEVVHHAALRPGDGGRPGQQRVRIVVHDAGGAVPLGPGVGHDGRRRRLRIGRSDEAHGLPDDAALTGRAIAVEIGEGAEADLVGILLEQSLRFVVRAVFHAIRLEAGGGVADLDADVYVEGDGKKLA